MTEKCSTCTNEGERWPGKRGSEREILVAPKIPIEEKRLTTGCDFNHYELSGRKATA